MTTPYELLEHATALHRAGRAGEAAPLYRRLLHACPDATDAWRLLGLAVHRGDPAQGCGAVRRALALEPGNADNLGALATILVSTNPSPFPGATDEVVPLLLRAIRLAPDSAEAFVVLGRTHRTRGAFRLAEAAFQAALLHQPDHLESRLSLALLLLERDEPDAAEPLLRTVLALQPALPEGLFHRGLALQLQGRTAEAEPVYRHLLACAPDHRRGLGLLARLRLLAGDTVEAEALFLAARAIDPDWFEVTSGLERCARYRKLAVMARESGLPSGLAVRGPFRDTSGYAWMVRRFVRGMAERGVTPHLIDLSVEFVPAMAPEQRDPFFEALDRPVRPRALLTFAIPGVAERVPGLLPVNFSMFEARTVPRSWVNYAAGLPHVIVPTRSSWEAWAGAGLPEERLRLCPLGVDPVSDATGPPLTVADTRGRRLADYPTRVLNVSDLVDRKNIAGLLRVWLRTTRADDGAALVLKLGKGNPALDGKAASFVEAMARSVGCRLDEAGPIFIIQGILSDAVMSGLFAACTHYWSMSHGEGWDLPMTQAGAMGLRLIAPRHSAYTTYLDDEVATLIPARLGPAGRPYHGLEWWIPDEDAAAGALGRALAGQDAPRRSACDKLAAEFSWQRATERLLDVLHGIGAL